MDKRDQKMFYSYFDTVEMLANQLEENNGRHKDRELSRSVERSWQTSRLLLMTCVTQSPGSDHWLHIPIPNLPTRRGKKQSGWLSLNDRDHWARRKKLTTYYREAGYDACIRANLPRYDRVHIVYWMCYGNNRRLDPSNYMLTVKAIVDGFVDFGLVKDDDSTRVIGPDPRRDERLPLGMHLQIIPL